MIKLGSQEIAKVMKGTEEVSAVYRGSDEVWSAGGGGGPIENISEVFSTYLYTGNTAPSRDIQNGIDLAGKGGLVWIKERSFSQDHILTDTERGATKTLVSNESRAEVTDTSHLTAFNSDGFTVGNGNEVNHNSQEFAPWTFRKAPKFFDIVTYEGTAYGQEIPHNLGCKPGMILVKSLDTSADWCVYHSARGPNFGFALNENRAEVADKRYWNDTEPTDTHFTVGNGSMVDNYQVKYVAYLFAGHAYDGLDDEVIKCGSYLGNHSSSGPEIDLGFEPQWLLIKAAESGQEWFIFDSVRGVVTGGNDKHLSPDNDSTEGNDQLLNFTSTGFKITNKSNWINSSDIKYVFMAIKSDPTFLMPPEWEQMNQEVAEKIAKRDAAKEAIASKVKDSKDIKDDS